MIWDFDYASISSISSLLEENGLSMTKKFGQNFLISIQALDKIVSLADIKEGTKVWEIGPGLGALTTKMLKAGAHVTAFEIDRGFCKILSEKAYPDCKEFTLIEGDALKTWKMEYQKNGCPDLICANLPYNVGSILIASFIENRCLPRKMVYTLQSEVVQRICANIGNDEYSGFSVLTSTDYENKEALKLKAGCFWPAPNVDSSVVVMTKREKSLVPEEYATKFFTITRALFAQRRKTVKNNLKAIASPEQIDNALEKANINPSERGERLTSAQILELTKNLSF